VRESENKEGLFVEEYFVVIEELVNERKNKIDATRHGYVRKVNDAKLQLSTFDLIMIIILRDKSTHRDKILRMMSDGSLLESGLLSGEHVSKLVELVEGGHTCISETTNSFAQFDYSPRLCLMELLVAFSKAILLAPLRCTIEFDEKEFFGKVRFFLIDIILKMPEDFQTKALSMMLRIVDKLMLESRNSIPKSMRIGETNTNICRNIFILLHSLSTKRREILMPFQDHLVEYITSESFDYLQKFDLLQAVCIAVAKLYCDKGGLDGIIICRGLLFSPLRQGTATISSQMHEKLVCRQIRGMVFADSIISCCDLDLTLLRTLHKVVSRVLLSPHSNILLLEPRLGIHGMKIIRRLRKQTDCDNPLGKDLFQVVSLVLSHSRIVHYPDGSSETVTPRTDSIFAHSKMPSFFLSENGTVRQRRFRKMTFCFNSFSFNETLLTQPASWEKSSLWIFELIDTYLSLGRTAKWNPRAWIVSSFVRYPRMLF
jgi:hypothetical protein